MRSRAGHDRLLAIDAHIVAAELHQLGHESALARSMLGTRLHGGLVGQRNHILEVCLYANPGRGEV